MVMKDAKMCCLRKTLTISALLMTMVLSIVNVHVVNGLSNDVRSTTRTSTVVEPTTTNSDIQTSSSYTPVTLSSLSSFARKFWTTMASMASTTKRADDVNLNTSSPNDDGHDSTNTTPIIVFDPISSDTHEITSVTEPSVSSSRLRDTSTTSENDAFIQEFPRGTSHRPRLTSSRKIRKNYYPTTFVPTSIPKISDNDDRATPDGTTNEFRRDRLNSNLIRSGRLRSGDRPSSASSSPVVTNETPREPITKSTTLCNDTTSEGTGIRHRDERPEQIIGTSLPDVTWPPPPPKFLKEEFSVGISDDREQQHHPFHQGGGGQELGQLFTSEPSSYSPQPDLETDFEVFPVIPTPLSTSSFSRPSESLQAPKRDFPLATTKSQVEYTVGQGRNRLSSTTFLPKSSSRPAPLKELTTNPPPTSPPLPSRTQPVTESASANTEVSLADLFDQDIIDNKTLLASSMFKLSSVLTSSLQTQEAAPLAANGSSDAHRRPTTSVPLTSDDDDSTSDFDFSTLFTSESLAPPTSNPFTHSSSSETTSTLPSLDLGGEDHPPTNDDVVLVNLVNKNLTSNNRLASLMSTGVVNSFSVQDVDDVNDNDEENNDFELVSEGLAPQFEEAGLVAGMKEQPEYKTLNRFSAQIRAPVKNSSEEPGECLFNVTDQARLCDWTFGSESSVHWSFGLGESAFMSGGPTLDSNGQTEGGYVFMDTSCGLQGPSNEIQRGSFESPLMSKTAPHGRCFTFWYNMGGLSADRLRVLLIPEEQFHAVAQVASRMPSFTTLWERKDTTNGTWMKGEVLYTFSKEHRLIFEGFARSGSDSRRKFQGYLAVDDLVIDSDSCKAFCTFEGVLCEWENDEANDEFDWELARGSDSHLTGPVRDHGDGPEGGFMFIDTAFPRRPGDIARLRSPELPSTDGPVCFRFWTHMYGNGIGTLRVVLVDSTDEKNVIWEVSGESGNSWHMAQVTVASSNSFRLSLEGMVGRNALGRIAIDDLSFGPGPCPSSPQSALPLRGDCTFESDECGWVNAGSGDHYDWLRTSAGQALLPGQGPNSGYRPPEPLSDHTTGLSSGFFLTMERSTIPPRGGDQAYVVGPTLQGTTGNNRCFSFWGYMHERSVDAAGPGLGSLRLYLRVGSSSILRPIWRLINYEHPDWFFAQAPINTNDKFQVVIGGTWGSTRQGAISVDDFTFFEGNCSVIPAEAEVIPGECTFDTNMCEWNSGLNRSRELSTWQLATSVRRPSNLDDHTYRATAGYVFFDIFSQQPHVVRLESPEIIADNETFWASTKTKGFSTTDDANSLDAVDDEEAVDTEHCLTFWFAPFGSSRNTFLRILQRDTASTNETQVWGVTTANFQAFRPEWVYGQVALNVTYTHRIIFEGSSNNGGFALDDIMFVPGTCQCKSLG